MLWPAVLIRPEQMRQDRDPRHPDAAGGSARSGFAHTCSSFPLASLAGPSRYQARVLRPSRCRPHCLTAADSKRLSRRVSGATKSAAVRTTGVAGVTQTLLYKKESGQFLVRTLEERRLPTLPPGVAVPSALAGLTSLFGMGRGGSPLLKPPQYIA